MMKLNLTSKNMEEYTKYVKPIKQFNFNTPVNPTFLEQIVREVVTYPKSKLKQFKKVCKLTLATLGSTLLLGTRTFAQTDTQMAKVDGLMPTDIIPYGIWAIVMLIVASGFLAIICYILSGNQKMLKKDKTEAVKWQKNIIRGYADVLAAPVVIALITLAAVLFFGHFNWYIKPFQILGGN